MNLLRTIWSKINHWWRISTVAPRLLRLNAYSSYLSRHFLLRAPFVLPHDKTYYGFNHLVNGGEGLFLDIGANDGISALGFQRVNKKYQILSIEPNPTHEKALKRIKRKYRNFDYKMIGAGSVSETKTLYIPFYKGIPIYTAASCDLPYVKQSMEDQFTSTHIGFVNYVPKQVQVLRLDNLNLKPDIIKIDSEGFEYQVLLGLEQTLKTWRPSVVMEFNPRFINGEISFLKSMGYQFFTYDYKKDSFSLFNIQQKEEWVGLGEFFFNVFCIPEEKSAHLPVSSKMASLHQ